MKISAKIDYACRALLELCLHWPDQSPLQIGIIAQRQEIPIKFLTHILIHLKQLGYVGSIRGKSGGYTLLKSPAEIKLSNVITQLGGLETIHESKHEHVFNKIWQEINEGVLKQMETITFESISARVRKQTDTLIFKI